MRARGHWGRKLGAAVVCSVLAGFGWSSRLQAQKRPHPPPARQHVPNPPVPSRPVQLPPRWLERLQNMSPEEQQRFLQNNRRFLSLPPEQQAEIRRRLEQWNRLSPQQRALLRRRERIWESLTPEQQREVREELLPQWRSLPPARRRLLLEKLRTLQNLPDPQREEYLRDPAFLTGLSAEEQQLLIRLARLRVSPNPGPRF